MTTITRCVVLIWPVDATLSEALSFDPRSTRSGVRQPSRERLPGSCADARCHSTDDLHRDSGEAPSPTQAALWLDIKRTYMELRPALRRLYMVELGFVPFEAIDVGGTTFHPGESGRPCRTSGSMRSSGDTAARALPRNVASASSRAPPRASRPCGHRREGADDAELFCVSGSPTGVPAAAPRSRNGSGRIDRRRCCWPAATCRMRQVPLPAGRTGARGAVI
jgi:hypothetical protein